MWVKVYFCAPIVTLSSTLEIKFTEAVSRAFPQKVIKTHYWNSSNLISNDEKYPPDVTTEPHYTQQCTTVSQIIYARWQPGSENNIWTQGLRWQHLKRYDIISGSTLTWNAHLMHVIDITLNLITCRVALFEMDMPRNYVQSNQVLDPLLMQRRISYHVLFIMSKSTHSPLRPYNTYVGRGSNIDVVNLDVAKAFDKVDFLVVMRKLQHLGISGKLGRWTHSSWQVEHRQLLWIESSLTMQKSNQKFNKDQPLVHCCFWSW